MHSRTILPVLGLAAVGALLSCGPRLTKGSALLVVTVDNQGVSGVTQLEVRVAVGLEERSTLLPLEGASFPVSFSTQIPAELGAAATVTVIGRDGSALDIAASDPVIAEISANQKTDVLVVLFANVCGDGEIRGDEVCDDSNISSGDGCRTDCKGFELCGDGLLDAGEACDDANTSDGDGCNATCQNEFCGDGVTQADEECDDGNQDNDDACLNDCTQAACGDTFVQDGEECDDGNAIDTDACLSNCQAATCGDGVTQSGVETCDPPGGACGPDCRLDCVVDADCQDQNACTQNERCINNVCATDAIDPADNNSCTIDSCDPASGVVHTPVNTGDGNECTEDSCNPSNGDISHTPVEVDDDNACTVDSCNPSNGDISHAPVNTNDSDVCTFDSCDPDTGVSHTPVNTNDGDDCTIDSCDPANGGISHSPAADGTECIPLAKDISPHICVSGDCVPSACGDGFKDPNAGEACDDGNQTSGDGCRADCRGTEVCGDGFLDSFLGKPHSLRFDYLTTTCDSLQTPIVFSVNGFALNAPLNSSCSCTPGISTLTITLNTNPGIFGSLAEGPNRFSVSWPSGVALAWAAVTIIADDYSQELVLANFMGTGDASAQETNLCLGNRFGDLTVSAEQHVISGERCDPLLNLGCSQVCALLSCRNGLLEPPEECDDGDDDPTDGCDSNCFLSSSGSITGSGSGSFSGSSGSSGSP